MFQKALIPYNYRDKLLTVSGTKYERLCGMILCNTLYLLSWCIY